MPVLIYLMEAKLLLLQKQLENYFCRETGIKLQKKSINKRLVLVFVTAVALIFFPSRLHVDESVDMSLQFGASVSYVTDSESSRAPESPF